jgi:hypothetical protein
MRKHALETFELNCPYEENHLKCEVKECEECAVLATFCRNYPRKNAQRSKFSNEIVTVSADIEDTQLVETE